MRSRATGSAGSVGRARPLPPPAPRARRPRCGPVPERNVFLFALCEKLRLALDVSVSCHQRSVTLRWFVHPPAQSPARRRPY